ncbi:peptide ABC transporter substrate-binding protein [Alkalibacter mobilis]|uniref:peptide ABC transporter substrate-binding protein n=1 Tax=Alkalibacter mobilis TaxID=2787712 RepID=UPI00189D5505|nr:peptide ABC transporter substrate-binding protein [Alkalibacter mobilis]MBF7096461.1 peptide ABC transporter substrate-binding protein [Alkalibacter mobilis]
MSKKKRVAVLSILLVLALVFSACSGGSDDNGNGDDAQPKILRTNNSSEPGSLDPALAQGTHESWVLDHVFEGLMKKSQTGEVVPGMAESYKMSDDGLTYTFKIRDDVKWSNGEPVTAHDFEYSWKRALDPETAAYYSYQFYYIKGGEAYNTGTGTVEDVGVKAIDDTTLEVVLENPAGFFLELTSFYCYFPVSKDVVEENPDWAKDPSTYVSNGPFLLTEWVHNASITLSKNDEYYDADMIKLDGIEFSILDDENTAWQRYEGGEFDFLTPLPQTVVAQMTADNNPELVIGTDLATYYYNLNTEVKPFNNLKVRQALSMAIDRESIVVDVAQGGQASAEGVVPFGIPDETGADFRDASGNHVTYDAAAAKTLLEEGLAEEGMTIEDMSNVTLLYNTNEAHKKIAQAIQEMWRTALGVEINLENVDFQVKLDREKAGDYEISRAGWIGDYIDPLTFIDLWVTDGPYNDANFSNAEYDAFVNTARNSTDQAERMEAMRNAEELLMGEMPVIPIYFYTQPYAQKSYVTGVYKPVNRYPYFIYADIVQE